MKCEKTIMEQEVTKVVEVPEYVLQLTEEEAETLMFVVGAVTGDTKGRRGHTDKMYEGLKSLGVRDLYPELKHSAYGTVNL